MGSATSSMSPSCTAWAAPEAGEVAAEVAEAEEEAAEAAAPRGGVRGVSAYVRKRPLLPSEAAKGDFDALSVEGGGGGGGRVVAHACLMRPDLVPSPQISPHLPISPHISLLRPDLAQTAPRLP